MSFQRGLKFLILVIISTGMLFFHASLCFTQIDMIGMDKDNSGKVEGWIINPETNESVNEEFSVRFYLDKKMENNLNPKYIEFKSDNKGYFKCRLFLGRYYLYTAPFKRGIYCCDNLPYNDPSNALQIDVKKGQITRVYKKACKGGNLKITLVDHIGEKLDVFEVFGNIDFSVIILNKKTAIGVSISNSENPSDDKRVFFFKNFAPGSYSIELVNSSGIYVSKIENVIINARTTTDYNLIIDIRTGIEGVVKDEMGNPIKFACVDIANIDDPSIWSEVLTGEDGHYKILGLNEGKYDLEYSADLQNGEIRSITMKNISILKNMVISINPILKLN